MQETGELTADRKKREYPRELGELEVRERWREIFDIVDILCQMSKNF
jgi:hypothetical protein